MTFDDMFNRYIVPLDPIPTGLKPSGSPRHPVKAVLFDVYGTLLISASGDLGGIRDTGDAPDAPDAEDAPDAGENAESRKSIASLLADFGLSLSSEYIIKTYVRTVGTAHERLKNRGTDFPEVQIDHIWRRILGFEDITAARKFALGFELIINPVYPMPGLSDMLAWSSRCGLKKGIISNAQFYTPLMIAYFCGNRPEGMGFDPSLLIYSYQVGAAKPSPKLFGAAAETLARRGIPPENVLFMGNDILNDIFPARLQGFQTALFAGDKRSLRLREGDPCCPGVKPDMVITALSQLPEFIA